MKKIIIISSIILGTVSFNYPVFDSEGISYIIILCCIVVITFSTAKIYFPDKEDYQSVEKKMDRLLQYDGIFTYTHEGFYFKEKDSMEFIQWDEIISVYFFSIPLQYHVRQERQTGLEIITDKRNYEFDQYNTPGIVKLKNELQNHFPTWELHSPTVIINNFGLEKTKLYEREKS